MNNNKFITCTYCNCLLKLSRVLKTKYDFAGFSVKSVRKEHLFLDSRYNRKIHRPCSADADNGLCRLSEKKMNIVFCTNNTMRMRGNTSKIHITTVQNEELTPL